jgi:uncharacterized protein YbaR (Trm112 family)
MLNASRDREMQLPQEMLDVIVCPRCKNKLEVVGSALECRHCRLRYRVVDGIPDLIVSHAEAIDNSSPLGR